jgi:hypothetical protein
MKIFGLIEKFKSLIGVRQSSAPTPGTNESAFYVNTNGDPGFVKDASDVETVSHLPTSTQKLAFTTASASDAAVTIPNSGTLPNTTEASALAAGLISTHNNKTGVHDVGSGDIVGTDKIQTLTGKKYDCGTASSSNAILLPSKAGESGALATESSLFYDSTAKKAKVYYDSKWNVIGGGLIVTPVTHTVTTLASGKHYLIDMSGASADITVTLPSGATESVVRVTATGNATNGWRVIVDANGSEKIAYDSAQYDSAKIIYADQWAEFSWDSNDSQWIVNDASSPLNGTFSGAIEVTGLITAAAGIKLPTSGGTASTLDFYEEYTLSSNILYVDSASQGFGIKVIRVGKAVTITNTVYATGTKVNTTRPIVQAGLPERFCPTQDVFAPWPVRDNSAWATGLIWIAANGDIQFYNANFAAWTASGDCSIERGSASYVIT